MVTENIFYNKQAVSQRFCGSLQKWQEHLCACLNHETVED